MTSESELKIMDFVLAAMGMKNKMERNIKNNTFSKVPATMPHSLRKKTNQITYELKGRKVWSLSPKDESGSEWVVLFLHGGAFYSNITQGHWSLINKLIQHTGATFIVPDYPLAPENACEDIVQFVDEVYSRLIRDYEGQRIAFMGDSAGAGLALSLLLKIQTTEIPLPEKVILFSPWLDVSMSNPEIDELDKHDKILHVEALREAGRNYAGNLSTTHFLVSPIYGDYVYEGEISIFTGTHDILLADARILKEKLSAQKIKANYFEYPGMCHDWVLITQLPGSVDTMLKVRDLLS